MIIASALEAELTIQAMTPPLIGVHVIDVDVFMVGIVFIMFTTTMPFP